MLSCRQVSELVSQAQDRPLGWLEKWRLRAHLTACEACRNFRKQMSFLRTSIRKHPTLGDGEGE